MPAAASTNSFFFRIGAAPAYAVTPTSSNSMPPSRKFMSLAKGSNSGSPAPFGGSREPSLEIDGRPAHRLAAQPLAVEPDVRQLVLGQFLGELTDGLALERHLVAAFDRARV